MTFTRPALHLEVLRPALWLAAEELEHHDPRVRAAAVEALAASTSEQATVAASARLDHQAWTVRAASLEATSRASQRGDSRVVTVACEALRDPELGMRRAAIAALLCVALPGDHGAVVALIERLEDPEPSLRQEAVKAISILREPGDTEVIARVSSLLSHRVWYVRNAAVEALAAAFKGDPWAADASASYLGNSERGVREAAGEALTRVAASDGDQHATSATLPFLRHKEWSVQSTAADIVSRLASKDDVKVVGALASLVEEPQCDSAQVAAALRVFRCRKEALSAVASRLKADKWFIRRSALHTLVSMEATGQEAEDILTPLLKDAGEAAQDSIEDALKQLRAGCGVKHGIKTAGYDVTGRPSSFPVAKDNHGSLGNRSILIG